MPARARQAYNDMASKFSAEGVEAKTMAVKMGKLQQIAAGALYSEDEVIDLHNEKIKWVESITRDPLRNHLIVYQFDFQVEQLEAEYPDLIVMPGDSAGVKKVCADWNAGLIRRLAVHSRSSGHGLNLAQGGHSIIWMSPTFSNDQFEQLNARLWRRGQRFPVTVCLLLAKDTVEDQVIVPRLESKAEIMPAFLAHLASIEAGQREEPARPRQKYNH
jgi:hypothetical protein